ncbi:probable glycosyltransferase At5g03795 [Tripterygium wilfordii]|uniref:probable glycosyltransferase At5g03795 n=1 Tax=Tripterygium wilfordii TaxID=458696 RepID=UPI0018F7FF52|nr:probable glycosyltransferase At5g03795 [Tripterygium wilfordii]
MEDFKIFIYPNKDENICYYNQWGIQGVFSSEKFFHYNLLTSDRYSTSDNFEADMFFISLTWLQIMGKGIYANGEEYLRYIINEYPHLNRTKGVHHFFVTCHDDGASLISVGEIKLMKIVPKKFHLQTLAKHFQTDKSDNSLIVAHPNIIFWLRP